jgi:hypothetical protein
MLNLVCENVTEKFKKFRITEFYKSIDFAKKKEECVCQIDLSFISFVFQQSIGESGEQLTSI